MAFFIPRRSISPQLILCQADGRPRILADTPAKQYLDCTRCETCCLATRSQSCQNQPSCSKSRFKSSFCCKACLAKSILKFFAVSASTVIA